jgi:hypothetical protein
MVTSVIQSHKLSQNFVTITSRNEMYFPLIEPGQNFKGEIKKIQCKQKGHKKEFSIYKTPVGTHSWYRHYAQKERQTLHFRFQRSAIIASRHESKQDVQYICYSFFMHHGFMNTLQLFKYTKFESSSHAMVLGENIGIEYTDVHSIIVATWLYVLKYSQ